MDNIYVIIRIAIYASMKVLGLLEKLLCTYSCCPITTSVLYFVVRNEIFGSDTSSITEIHVPSSLLANLLTLYFSTTNIEVWIPDHVCVRNNLQAVLLAGV